MTANQFSPSRISKWAIVCASLLLMLIIVTFNRVSFHAHLSQQFYKQFSTSVNNSFVEGSANAIPQNGLCRLLDLNPWDDSVAQFLEPISGKKEHCSLSSTPYTELKNHEIRIIKELKGGELCKYRCILPNGEENYTAHEWKMLEVNVSTRCECEFVETRCLQNSSVIFAYLHMQVIRDDEKSYQADDRSNPSVLLFVVDSTSSSSSARALPKTRHVLRKYYDSIPFYYHSKVGSISRPNAHAFFAGNRIEPLHIGATRGLNLVLEEEVKDSCKKPIPPKQMVIYEFEKINYAIGIADDWTNAFAWPDCIGYEHLPSRHYMRTLSARFDADRKLFAKDFVDLKCITMAHKMLDYMSMFLDSYIGAAKFMHMWTNVLSHNTLYGVHDGDDIFSEFFLRNVAQLNNTIIIFMADHGMRFGGFRNTDLGETEENNPMLEFAFPKWLQENHELMMNVRDNSRLHTSHYDLHATLIDIVKVARKDHFQRFDDYHFKKEIGAVRARRAKSLLRPIRINRTCDQMDIDDAFCLCVEKWIPFNETSNSSSSNSRFLTLAAESIVEALNGILVASKLDHLCETLQLKEVLTTEKHESQPVLRIKISTNPIGTYEALVRYDNSDQFHLASLIHRVDRYGKTADCASFSEDRQYCYCKVQNTE